MKRHLAPLLLSLLLPVAAMAQQSVRVDNSTKLVTEPSSFWTDNAAGICSGINATVAPVWANVTGKPTTLSGYGITDAQPLDADLTSIAGLTTDSYGRGYLALENIAQGLSYLGIPFEEIPSHVPWPANNTIYWNGAQFVATPLTATGRDIAASTDAAAARTAIGLGNVDNTADASKSVAFATGATTADNADAIYDGSTYVSTGSIFDGTQGDVFSARNLYNAAGAYSYTYEDIATLFDGSGGYVNESIFSDNANTAVYEATGTYQLSSLFDGSGGNVDRAAKADAGWDSVASVYSTFGGAAFAGIPFYAGGNYTGDGLQAAYASTCYTAEKTSGGANDLSSLFDGSGGWVDNANAAEFSSVANRVRTVNGDAPNATDPGVAGTMVFTDTYTYRCFASGDWRRTPVTYTGGY